MIHDTYIEVLIIKIREVFVILMELFVKPRTFDGNWTVNENVFKNQEKCGHIQKEQEILHTLGQNFI